MLFLSKLVIFDISESSISASDTAPCRKRLMLHKKNRTTKTVKALFCQPGRYSHTFKLDLSGPLAAVLLKPAAISSSENSLRLPSCRSTV